MERYTFIWTSRNTEKFFSNGCYTEKHETFFFVSTANIIIQIQGIRNDDEDILVLGDINIP